jgi:malate dehydrogenase
MEEDLMLRRSECRAKGGAPGFKVAILGAAGGIGQPLALLMKMNPLVSVLHLYDVVNTPGVTADISHMDTGAVVSIVTNILYKQAMSIVMNKNERSTLYNNAN